LDGKAWIKSSFDKKKETKSKDIRKGIEDKLVYKSQSEKEMKS